MPPKTLEEVAAEYTAHAPKSICICGHLGDGANSEHADYFNAGHGECLAAGCDCTHFRWAKFTDAFMAAYRKALS